MASQTDAYLYGMREIANGHVLVAQGAWIDVQFLDT